MWHRVSDEPRVQSIPPEALLAQGAEAGVGAGGPTVRICDGFSGGMCCAE
jgi:hypothetical protein